MLSDYERTYMRQAQAVHMMDKCHILVDKPIQDSSGQPMPHFDEGPEIDCGFDFRLAREDFAESGEIEKSFGFLRIPITVQIKKTYRVKITFRQGEKLEPPWVFAVSGIARQGPTATIVGLREIDK